MRYLWVVAALVVAGAAPAQASPPTKPVPTVSPSARPRPGASPPPASPSTEPDPAPVPATPAPMSAQPEVQRVLPRVAAPSPSPVVVDFRPPPADPALAARGQRLVELAAAYRTGADLGGRLAAEEASASRGAAREKRERIDVARVYARSSVVPEELVETWWDLQLASGHRQPHAEEPAARADDRAGELDRLRAELGLAGARAEALASAVDPATRELLRVGANLPAGAGRLRLPVPSTAVGGFGNRFDPYFHRWQEHAGVDLAAELGAPVLAAAAGRVARAGWAGGYGYYTCVDHGTAEHLSTCYAHQSVLLVAEGAQVVAGQPIGLVGTTGASTGPHLHFEVRLDGRAVDPAPRVG